jgi:hypothetical protein
MIFGDQTITKLIAGDKTVTRRLWRPGDVFDGEVVRNRSQIRYAVGQERAIQPGRGKAGVAKLKIKSICMERLGAVDDDDARLEGFENREAFVRYWKFLHGKFMAATLVWRIEFEVIDG